MSEEKLIRVSYGMTINLGNFESERIDCSLTLPVEEEFEVQFDKMFRKVKMKVMDKGGKFDAKQEALDPDLEYKNDPRVKDAPQIIMTEETSMTWEMEYEEKNYKKFTPCKYKCGLWTGWGKPYNEGDKILHINPGTKEIIGFQCPKFAEEGK